MSPSEEPQEGEMNIAQRVSVDPKVEEFLSARRNLLIDGKWVSARSGKTFPVYDPSTGAVMAQVAEADAADIDKAVKAARKAFEQGPWPRMSPSERGRILWKLADLIEKRTEEFATLESLDNGKPLAVACSTDRRHVPLYGGLGDEAPGRRPRSRFRESTSPSPCASPSGSSAR
jgi:phenylacetaldehyde dehydrogenase